MDFGTFSGLYTAFLMAIFFGIIAWAYSKKRNKDFSEAANLVFADEPATKLEKDFEGAQKK
ncbi:MULTISPECIES: cbb3-type cytochrome oxidase subunit 3 [unclassified Agarivorans]|uniref:cbb3-type cytochrome oxidase subunit 3 n=1 Tax=unclassified Agarivorans TaxID=2636026 RepID=UPI003D7D8BB9